MPKKTQGIKNGNGGHPDRGASAGEEVIDAGTGRLTSTSGRNGRPARKKRAVTQKTGLPRRRVKRKPTEPADEQVRLRAYFISERRQRLGLAGDASSDWLEAKRQLLLEQAPR